MEELLLCSATKLLGHRFVAWDTYRVTLGFELMLYTTIWWTSPAIEADSAHKKSLERLLYIL